MERFRRLLGYGKEPSEYSLCECVCFFGERIRIVYWTLDLPICEANVNRMLIEILGVISELKLAFRNDIKSEIVRYDGIEADYAVQVRAYFY